MLPLAAACHAQDTQTAKTVPEMKERYDLGLGGFYQVTHSSNGNFIREDTTESAGGLLSFRQPYRPWLDMKRTSATPAFPRRTTRAW